LRPPNRLRLRVSNELVTSRGYQSELIDRPSVRHGTVDSGRGYIAREAVDRKDEVDCGHLSGHYLVRRSHRQKVVQVLVLGRGVPQSEAYVPLRHVVAVAIR